MRATTPALVLETVGRIFGEWLEEKGLSAMGAATQSRRWESGDRTATSRELSTDHGRLLQCMLVEPNITLGTWSTEVLASSAGWIDVRVRNSAGNLVKVPRLAKALMRALDLRDASLQLRDNVKLWDVADLDQLVALLQDPDRHGLVFVAGTGPEPGLYEAFHDKIPVWTREVFGLAQSIVLTPQATWALGERLSYHGVAPWTLRTYYPGVDPGSAIDARRHRYMLTATLATQEDHHVRRVLGDIARAHAVARPEPLEVLRARRAFERAEVSDLLEVMDKAEPPVEVDHGDRPAKTHGVDTPQRADVQSPKRITHAGAEGETSADALAIVRSSLGISEITRESIAAAVAFLARAQRDKELSDSVKAARLRIKEQAARVEELQDELRAAQSLLDDDELDRALLQDEVESARAESRWLRAKFQELGEHELAFSQTPDGYSTDYPESCADLVTRLADDDVLVFTGAQDQVSEVDDLDSLQLAARAAWDACLSLREYARARAEGVCDSGVDHFLRFRPQGFFGVSPGKHAVTETRATMNQFGNERVFPVPEVVAEAGFITMTAHFKLTRIGLSSPRLYYFDDLPKSGRIYIGYLGRHLTNTQTN